MKKREKSHSHPILIINSTQKEEVNICLKDKENIFCLEKETRAQQLPFLIEELFNSRRIKVDQISRVKIVSGEGSLTGYRIGLAVAKTLNYLLNSRIDTISQSDFDLLIAQSKALKIS